jgi:hypothetical protein
MLLTGFMNLLIPWATTATNLDNNEIGIGQDCAATLGVMREIFTIASSLVVGGEKLYHASLFSLHILI